MIIRNAYIEKTKKYVDVPLVKILVGVRRSGKSTILEMISQMLEESGVPKSNIIKIRLDDVLFVGSLDAKTIYLKIQEDCSRSEGKKYILLDEVQEVEGWEKMVNSLIESLHADVYVTGSNSKLMSSEISTYLSGRYVTISVYTLSFSEYLAFKERIPENSDLDYEFSLYLREGGFPGIVLAQRKGVDGYSAVLDIYQSVVLSDIVKRYEIRSLDLFNRVTRFIFDNVGKTFSANAIKNFLKSEGRNVNPETIYNYISYLEKSFVIYRCQRFDLQGKALLKTQEKYFLSDPSLKYALMGFSPRSIAAMMENVLYLEMRRRGYEVYVGKLGNKEIDFVGIKDGKRIYIQLAREKPSFSNRESDNLKAIQDNYRKYIVTMDRMYVGDDEGIDVVYLPEFLLRKEW